MTSLAGMRGVYIDFWRVSPRKGIENGATQKTKTSDLTSQIFRLWKVVEASGRFPALKIEFFRNLKTFIFGDRSFWKLLEASRSFWNVLEASGMFWKDFPTLKIEFFSKF